MEYLYNELEALVASVECEPWFTGLREKRELDKNVNQKVWSIEKKSELGSRTSMVHIFWFT